MTDGSKDRDKSGQGERPKEQDLRKQRLAEALRTNLQKRKMQARSRRTGQPDARPEGLAAAKEGPKR